MKRKLFTDLYNDLHREFERDIFEHGTCSGFTDFKEYVDSMTIHDLIDRLSDMELSGVECDE